MTEHEFVSGVIQDLPDDRDHQAEEIYLAMGVAEGTFPDVLDLRGDMTPIRNQGSRPTCAAFAAAAIKEWQERKDVGLQGYMSPEFVYFFRSNKPAEGMYSRDVMDILLKKGICQEISLVYGSKDVSSISQKVQDSALGYKIKEYARITSLEGLKTSLYQSGPCYISFPVYDVMPEFWRKSSDSVAKKGGHATVVVGYTKKGFIIRNSWGTNFGTKGYVIYPYDDWGAHWDIWASVDSTGSPKPLDPPKKSGCCEIS